MKSPVAGEARANELVAVVQPAEVAAADFVICRRGPMPRTKGNAASAAGVADAEVLQDGFWASEPPLKFLP